MVGDIPPLIVNTRVYQSSYLLPRRLFFLLLCSFLALILASVSAFWLVDGQSAPIPLRTSHIQILHSVFLVLRRFARYNSSGRRLNETVELLEAPFDIVRLLSGFIGLDDKRVGPLRRISGRPQFLMDDRGEER